VAALYKLAKAMLDEDGIDNAMNVLSSFLDVATLLAAEPAYDDAAIPLPPQPNNLRFAFYRHCARVLGFRGGRGDFGQEFKEALRLHWPDVGPNP
jgi:hypothetical protein